MGHESKSLASVIEYISVLDDRVLVKIRVQNAKITHSIIVYFALFILPGFLLMLAIRHIVYNLKYDIFPTSIVFFKPQT